MISVYNICMIRPPLPLTAVPWSAELANVLADASGAIARLDARICASSLAPTWQLRASWTGYGNALRFQNFEIDEIDIISRECGLHLAGRQRLETVGDPFSAIEPWRAVGCQSRAQLRALNSNRRAILGCIQSARHSACCSRY